MSVPIHFDVKFVPAGTGSVVWDDPYADQVVQKFMPPTVDTDPCSASFTWVPSAPPP